MQISDICKHLQKIDTSIILEEDTNYLLIDPSKWDEISNKLVSSKDLSFSSEKCDQLYFCYYHYDNL